LANTPAAPVTDALNTVISNIDPLFTGSVSSWESLIPAVTVKSFYDFVSEFDSSAFFKPNLRVLEVGN
jgi:hypothetical protein